MTAKKLVVVSIVIVVPVIIIVLILLILIVITTVMVLVATFIVTVNVATTCRRIKLPYSARPELRSPTAAAAASGKQCSPYVWGLLYRGNLGVISG